MSCGCDKEHADFTLTFRLVLTNLILGLDSLHPQHFSKAAKSQPRSQTRRYIMIIVVVKTNMVDMSENRGPFFECHNKGLSNENGGPISTLPQ